MDPANDAEEAASAAAAVAAAALLEYTLTAEEYRSSRDALECDEEISPCDSNHDLLYISLKLTVT